MISVGRRVVLNSISWLFVERAPEVFLQHMRMCQEWWKLCLTAFICMPTLCLHVCASAKRKFNTLIYFSTRWAIQFWSGSILMLECFKNIKWRDVAKKIRHWSFTFWKRICYFFSSFSPLILSFNILTWKVYHVVPSMTCKLTWHKVPWCCRAC